jgi:hypothetical protein
MARSLSLIVACALAMVTFASAHAQDSAPSSPSLGDLARQAQKDKDRTRNEDSATKAAAKVFTNDDLSSSPAGVSAGPGGGSGQATQLPAGSKPAAAALTPSEKIAKLEAFLDQVESLDRATLVQTALQGRDTDFPGRAKWEERLFAAKLTYVEQARDVIQKARQIVGSADSIKGIQDQNDPRVKDMNARLQVLIREAVQTDAAFQAVMMEGRDLAAPAGAH